MTNFPFQNVLPLLQFASINVPFGKDMKQYQLQTNTKYVISKYGKTQMHSTSRNNQNKVKLTRNCNIIQYELRTLILSSVKTK